MDKLRVKVNSLEKDQTPRAHDMDRWSKCSGTVKHWFEMHSIYLHARHILQCVWCKKLLIQKVTMRDVLYKVCNLLGKP